MTLSSRAMSSKIKEATQTVTMSQICLRTTDFHHNLSHVKRIKCTSKKEKETYYL